MTDTPMRACLDSSRRCSLISAGPVAQFSPIMSMPRASSAVRAAAVSEPSSIVPVVSTVIWAKTGTSRVPIMARWAPTIAALACNRSCAVSISTASTPPASIPATWSR